MIVNADTSLIARANTRGLNQICAIEPKSKLDPGGFSPIHSANVKHAPSSRRKARKTQL
ncbi:MAG: hypothetical protein ACLPID_21235 [Beijerinckiaceae bacterium]